MQRIPMETGGATMVTTHFVDSGHDEIAEYSQNDCRGINGKGTVLSRIAVDQRFVIEEYKQGDPCSCREIENLSVKLTQGTPMSCAFCRENEL